PQAIVIRIKDRMTIEGHLHVLANRLFEMEVRNSAVNLLAGDSMFLLELSFVALDRYAAKTKFNPVLVFLRFRSRRGAGYRLTFTGGGNIARESHVTSDPSAKEERGRESAARTRNGALMVIG